MLKSKKVAVTGPLASGKTTVCHFFNVMGAYTVNADQLVHELLSPKTEIGKQVIHLLGDEIVNGETLNREIIAEKVFSDPTLLKELEKRLHPEVQKEIDRKYQQLPEESPLFIAEVPLLYEAHLEGHYDYVILVDREISLREKEYSKEKKDFKKREERLLPMQEKKRLADVVIHNNRSLLLLEKECKQIFNQITGRV